MKKLEKEYTVIKTKEQEEMVELKVSVKNRYMLLFHAWHVSFVTADSFVEIAIRESIIATAS